MGYICSTHLVTINGEVHGVLTGARIYCTIVDVQ